MKTVVAIIAAMIVSSAITFIVTSSSTQTKTEDRKASENNTHKEELAALRKEMVKLRADAGSQAAMVLKESNVQVPGVVTDPADLIEQLSAEGTTGADVESQKRVIHYFESLVDASGESLPAIANFMDQGVDKEFGRPSMRQQLNITNAQMEDIRAFGEKQREEMGTKMREIWGNQELTREERGQKMREIFSGSQEKFMELMTDDQKAQIEQMGGDQGDRIRMMMRMGGGDRGGRTGGDRGGRGGDRGGGRGGR
jgi:Spy/CpxP family protein refolding chaperone